MSPSPLMSGLRLLHGVLGFLVRQSEEQVAAFAEGHIRLAFVSASGTKPNPEPVNPVVVPVEAVEAATKAKKSPGSAKKKTMPTIDGQEAAAIAEKLRSLKTESEGLAYLGEVARNNEDRKLIAKALKIEGSGSMTTAKLLTQIVRHAIGARRTFAGLSSW